MALGLTNLDIAPVRGNAALLPNQPIIQGAKVDASESATLKPGDVVTFSTATPADAIVVKKAAVTDLPVGVVVGNPIKTGFVAGDSISFFPAGSFVYMESGSSTINRGTKVQFDTAGKVKSTSTASNGYVGTAWTAAAAEGDIIIVKIDPSI